MIPVPLSALLAGVLAVVLMLGATGWKAYDAGEAHQSAVDGAAIQQQKIEAAATLAQETNRANEATRKLASNVADQEKKDVANSNAIDDLAGQLRTAAVNGRLRDPNARRGSCSSGPASGPTRPASAGQGDGAEAPGLLSTELTGLLQRLQREADVINNAYTSCRNERWGLQQELNKRDGTHR